MNFFWTMSIRLRLSTSMTATTDDLSGNATSLITSLNPGYLSLKVVTRLPFFMLKMLRLCFVLSAS